jgi:DNA polymerase-3 subunit delta
MAAKRVNCHLVCGDDDFLVALEARRLIDTLVPEENRLFGLEVVEGRVETVDESLTAVRKTLEALMMDGLFGSDKLIWLREPAFLSSDRLARSEALKGPLAGLTAAIKAGLPEGQHLLLTTGRIHRASALFKAFAATGEVNDFGNNLKPWECARRARQFLDRWLPVIDMSLDEPVKEQFLARVGSDTRQIASELEKLRCYAGPGKPVTAADVKSIVSGGGVTEIWDFLDAFGRRDLAGLIRQLRLLLSQSEHPIRLANSLESRVNDLILVREALDRQWAQADSYAGLRWNPLPPATEAWLAARDPDIRKWPAFRTKGLMVQAAAWALKDLRVARHLLVQMREDLVSSSLPREWLLEIGLIRAVGRKPRTGGRSAAPVRTEPGPPAARV